MAKRILSISLIDDTFQYLEVEKQPAGFFPLPPPPTVTQESLMSACRKADEIYLNGIFSRALYEWGTFPKVARRYLTTLITKDARGKLGTPYPIQVHFKTLKEVIEAGVAKWQVAYIATDEETLNLFWKTFKDFTRKIKFITPLPVALASMISQVDHPRENFSVVWIGENSSVVTISSPEGLVKVARSVPMGLPKKRLPDSPDFLKQFSRELGKEISMTLTFFKQQFREPVPSSLYLLGNNFLPEVFQNYPLPVLASDIRFRLSALPVQGMKENEVNDNLNLIGNLYPPDAFNFIPHEEILTRKTALAYNIAYAILLIIIVLGGLWWLRLTALESSRISEFNIKLSQLQTLQQQVKFLRNNVNQLKPFEGWKLFYEETFKNQPQWNMLLSELGLLVPSNIVIETFQILPEKGADGTIWNSQMSGKIQAKNWQEGLNLLRQFGGTLQSSPFFEVTNIDYAPEEMKNEAKTFDFQIAMKIKPEEPGHAL